MSVYRNLPRLSKGALIGMSPITGLSGTVTVLQYNPAEMTRTVSASRDSSKAGTSWPSESFAMKVHLDAADQLERADSLAMSTGIHPQLAALETLVFPRVASILAGVALSRAGVIESVPADRPLAIFVWGSLRILPVRISQFSVRETAFDNRLNPIRAEIDLGMEVVSCGELGWRNMGAWLYMANRVHREGLGLMHSAVTAEQLANQIVEKL